MTGFQSVFSGLSNRTDRATTNAVSRRLLSAEGRVRAQGIPCGIYGAQSETGTGLFPSSFVFTIIPHWLCILTYHVGDQQ